MSPFCELVREICTITAMKYQPLLKRNPKNDERAEQVKLNVNLRGLLIHLHSRFLYTVSVLEVYDMLFLIRFSWSVDITIKYWHLYIYLFSGTSDLLQSIQPILKILYSYIAVLAKWYLNRNWYRSISYILWIISHFKNKSFFVITIQVFPTYHVENFNKKMKMKTIMFLNGM